jgi:hypothetical protein
MKAKGKHGSWFATTSRGETLPCVHKYWADHWPNYLDPGVTPGARKADEYIAAIKSGKRVILCDDNVSSDESEFKRAGYIAMYEVDNVEADERGMRFTFVRRLR